MEAPRRAALISWERQEIGTCPRGHEPTLVTIKYVGNEESVNPDTCLKCGATLDVGGDAA